MDIYCFPWNFRCFVFNCKMFSFSIEINFHLKFVLFVFFFFFFSSCIDSMNGSVRVRSDLGCLWNLDYKTPLKHGFLCFLCFIRSFRVVRLQNKLNDFFSIYFNWKPRRNQSTIKWFLIFLMKRRFIISNLAIFWLWKIVYHLFMPIFQYEKSKEQEDRIETIVKLLATITRCSVAVGCEIFVWPGHWFGFRFLCTTWNAMDSCFFLSWSFVTWRDQTCEVISTVQIATGHRNPRRSPRLRH